MHPEALTENSRAIFLGLRHFSDFYLAGGTALALQIGHRISVDFDLFAKESIQRTLYPRIKKVFADKNIEASVNNQDELTVFVDKVKITFLAYPFPVVNELVSYEKIRMLNVPEIASTKAYSIGRRGSYKDYVDLYFIISGRLSSLIKIIELAGKKYSGEFNARLFLEQLVYMEDIADEGIIFLKKGATKLQIERLFTQEVKNLKL